MDHILLLDCINKADGSLNTGSRKTLTSQDSGFDLSNRAEIGQVLQSPKASNTDENV